MNKQDLLNCDLSTQEGKAELSRLLGEVLEPDREQCTCDKPVNMDIWNELRCSKCGLYPNENIIPLTPANAFKYRDRAVEKFGRVKYFEALCHAMFKWYNAAEMDFVVVAGQIALDAQPHHYLITSAICELEAKQ